MKTNCKLVFLTALIGLAVSAQASVIGLFNTGVDATGNPLVNGATPDLHYSLISVPGGTTVTRVLTSADGFPIGPWLGDSSVSAWIGPNTADANGPVGTYIYRTTFDLTGLNPLTASITGRWSTDNNGLGIFLNGVWTQSPSPGYSDFGSWTSFSFGPSATIFLPGVNTLDFYLNNGGGPTGLRVEMSGTAAPVPEPSTIIAGALLLLPIGVSTLRFFRKNRTA